VVAVAATSVWSTRCTILDPIATALKLAREDDSNGEQETEFLSFGPIASWDIHSQKGSP
jgi:hypothetical protein